MVTKWMEIDSEMFLTVFNKFWNQEKNDKVLEIQNIQAISERQPNVRTFFGAKINLSDYEYWNKASIEMMKITDRLSAKVGGIIKSMSDFKVSVCFLEGGGPRISPFGSVPPHYNLICGLFFGEQFEPDGVFTIPKKVTNMWYNKKTESDKIYFTYEPRTPDDKKERFFRVRVYDFKDWELAVEDYIRNGKFDSSLMSDDIHASDIVVTSKPDKVSNPYM